MKRLDGIRLLWHLGYWDGPLTGIAIHEGREHFFEAENPDEPLSDRRFLLFPLSDEEIVEERYWHSLFQEHVGAHTDYGEDGRRTAGAVRPRSEWDRFYEPAKERKPRNYREREPVGFFCRGRG